MYKSAGMKPPTFIQPNILEIVWFQNESRLMGFIYQIYASPLRGKDSYGA